MKKSLSVLLAVLMLISCFSGVNVFAEETKPVMEVSTEKAKELLIEKFNQFDYPIEYIGADENFCYFFQHDVLGQPATNEKWMGNYLFYAPCWYFPGDYRIYAVNNATAYAIEDAYDEGLISDMEYVGNLLDESDIIESIAITRYSDDVKLFYENGFTVKWADYLGNVGDYQLYHAGNRGSSTSGTTAINYIPIGNYLFCHAYGGEITELYLRNENKIVRLKNAYINKQITDDDMDTIYSILFNEENKDRDYIWTVKKMDENTRRLYAIIDSGYHIKWVNKLGVVGDYELCYGGVDVETNMVEDVIIGKYKFKTTSQHFPEYTGLYIRNDQTVYPLTKAYADGIITDADMDMVYSVLYNEDNKDRQYNWTVERMDDIKASFYRHLISRNLPVGNITYYELAQWNNYTICYGGTVRGFGDFSVTVGDYTFTGYNKYNTSDVSLYLVDAENVYPIEEAYNKKIIDDSDMEEIVSEKLNAENVQEFLSQEKLTIRKTGDIVSEHNYRAEITQKATCTENGIKTYICIYCDDSYTEEIPAKGHTAVKDKAVAPTCTKTGLTDGEHCSECNEVLVKQKVVKAKGHSTKIAGEKKATYFAKGNKGNKVCKNCGKIISKGKSIPKLKLKTPKLSVSCKKKQITVKYHKVKNATGFQIKYKEGKKTSTVNVDTKKSMILITMAKKGTCKVQIRAFVKSGSKIAYSSWTKAKKVKVK